MEKGNAEGLWRVWEEYEGSEGWARLSPGSRNAKKRAWMRFSAWMGAVHPEIGELGGVTPGMAAEYVETLRPGRAGVTCSLQVCILREITRAVLMRRAGGGVASTANPWEGVRLRACDGWTRRELALEEVKRLFAAAESRGPQWRLLFSLAVYAGLRLGDCCLLAWDAVDLAAGVLRVVPRKTRRYLAGRPVVIPLHAELAAELAAVPPAERGGCVLPAIASDYGLRRWALSRALSGIFAEAGIETSVAVEGRSRRAPSATFHSLRHTFVSVAVNAGIPLATVQAIVGHKSTAMTRHYYHPSVDALRRAVDAMPPIMQSAAGAAASAAVAGVAVAGAAVAGARVRSGRPRSLSSRLQDIARALAKGLITPQEFASLRAAILADA